MRIEDILKHRILILDGAMGTMIQRYMLSESDYRGVQFANFSKALKGNNDLLCLTQPLKISEIHRQYLEAGADIIETNTFNATSISLSDYDLQSFIYEINKSAAQLAKALTNEFTLKNPDKPRFVAGSIGPTNKTASVSPDVNNPAYRAADFDDFVESYTEQVRGLIDGGVDILLIETVFDTLNCKAALFAIENYFEKHKIRLPVMVSLTITDNSGRTFTGQTPEAFLASVSHAPLLSIGLNCAFGAEQLFPYLKELAANTHFYTSAHPNAGLPDEMGKYKQSAIEMARHIEDYLKNGLVNIIGGCCGSTPEHIAEIAKIVEQYPARKPSPKESTTILSGLETIKMFENSTFFNIGERTNVAGSKKFANLIKDGKYEEALSVARQQIENGAQLIDVSMDDAMLDAKKEMTTFLNYIAGEPDIAKVPIMIDSSNWDVLEAGLKCLQGKGIVNSISLKDGETAFIQKAMTIKKYGAALVVMAFDEEGQAVNVEQKTAICKRAYHILTQKVGIQAEDIIFDPNILSIATGIKEHDNYALEFIKATKWIKDNLPGAKVSGGISNLSFAFRGNSEIRESMHSVFLYHAIKAGMDMGIVNAGNLPIYDEISKDLKVLLEDVVLNRRKDATERLIAYAANKTNSQEHEKAVAEWRNYEVDEKLSFALVHGIADYLDEDLAQALQKHHNPLDIIEIPLMDGMNTVGELFGSGKMFLPQVIKSARVMKKAVSILLPYIEHYNSGQATTKAGKILLATVKGDVHDIGKNIVGVVLSCNNYEILDLGVMVSAEKILQKAKEENADIIGLSGLITPSLHEMVYVAEEMERQKFKVPLLIGGATTSQIHTALKIAQAYSQAVVHVKDASLSVRVVNSLLSKDVKDEYAKKLKQEYNVLIEDYNSRQSRKQYITFKEALNNKPNLSFDTSNIKKPNKMGIQVLKNYPIHELIGYIDWTFFFKAWEFKGSYPQIFEDPIHGKEAKKLHADALSLLQRIERDNMITVHGVIGIFEAVSHGNTVKVYENNISDNPHEFNFLRNQELKNGEPNYCLSDFIAPSENKSPDYLGLFACTAGIGVAENVKAFKEQNDDYNAILFQILADRLAEAMAERMHYIVRKDIWGYKSEEIEDAQLFLKEKYQGIRPASGYPACPFHKDKQKIFKLLNAGENIGVNLSESYLMIPTASVSGWYFAHPQAKYFNVGKIGIDQVQWLAQQENIELQEAEALLIQHLNYTF